MEEHEAAWRSPAQEQGVCKCRCERPEHEGPWEAVKCFARNMAGAVLGPSTSLTSSSFSPSSVRLPSAGTGGAPFPPCGPSRNRFCKPQ